MLIIFDSPVPDVGVQARPTEKLSVEQIENNRVVRIDTDIDWGGGDENLSIWYAKPKPNVLIAATHAGFMKTVLQRTAHPPATRTALLDFAEWKFVDTNAPVWGIRHRRTAAPIWIVTKSWQEPLPPTALDGITYCYQPHSSNSITWRWHFSEQVRAALPRAIEREKLNAKLITPLVMEQRLLINDRSDDRDEAKPVTPYLASFMMQHFMGYVVCP